MIRRGINFAIVLLTLVALNSASAGAPDKQGRWAIVPGRRIGGVSIGEDSEKVWRHLGRPTTSDAAMGHQWETWRAHGQSLSVYSSLSEAGYDAVREIRVTSSRFRTRGGLSTNSSLARIRHAFPGALPVAYFASAHPRGPVYLYDDEAKGIAFEVRRPRSARSAGGRCLAIIVHQPGQNAAQSYLPLDPDHPYQPLPARQPNHAPLKRVARPAHRRARAG